MGKTIDLSPSDEQQKALLAGLYLTGQRDEAGRPVTREAYDRQMLELEELAKACGLRVVGICIQSASEITQKTFLGSGKVDEIRLMIEETDADIVLFNESLSPMQVRNLEKAWDTEVLDRTGIILQIFSRRARTREARLQVECARLKYMLPRLAGLRVGLSRQGGGSGRLSNKGAGEEQLELDRRHIEHRIAELERQLKGVSRERAAQRSQRLSENICRVALVGYTNAGKSTLMNALLSRSAPSSRKKGSRSAAPGGREVFTEDMVFATLDTTVRRIQIWPHAAFLLSDTVGCISQLPLELVSAFHSTLEEAALADLLLLVADCSDPDYPHQLEVAARTLKEIGAGEIPVITVLNKADLAEQDEYESAVPRDWPCIRRDPVNGDRIYLSAKKKEGLDDLLLLLDPYIGTVVPSYAEYDGGLEPPQP